MRILKTIIGIAVLLGTIGAVAGLWAYFEWLAPRVPGKIVDKQERIAGSGVHRSPGRYLSTSFKLKDETEEDRYIYGSPHVTDVDVDLPTYERLAVGASVTVKYLPINPAMARLEGQPLVPPRIWSFVVAILLMLGALIPKRTRMAVVLCAAFAAAFLVTIPGPPSAPFALTASITLTSLALIAALLRRGSPALLLGVFMVAMATFTGWPMMQAARAETLTAQAEVRSVSTFQETRRRTGALRLQAFDRVHAVFVPQGAKEPVYLLDFVDHDTAAGLREGAHVAIEYKANRPEAGRLAEGARTHYWKNAIVPVAAVLGLGWLTGRRTRKKPSAKSPRQAPGPAQPL